MPHHFIAVLDTMYGNKPGRAPRWFYINPKNTSGRRLYQLTRTTYMDHLLRVTNACPELVDSAHQHGKPDAEWVLHNLESMTRGNYNPWATATLLVCGSIAHRTYKLSEWQHAGPVIFLPHPAARVWRTSFITPIAEFLAHVTHGNFWIDCQIA